MEHFAGTEEERVNDLTELVVALRRLIERVVSPATAAEVVAGAHAVVYAGVRVIYGRRLAARVDPLDAQSRREGLVLTCLAGTPEQIDAAAYALVDALQDAEDVAPAVVPAGTARACGEDPSFHGGWCHNCPIHPPGTCAHDERKL